MNLVHDRVEFLSLSAPYGDLGALLSTVFRYIVPFSLLLPMFFLAEFSLSDVCQRIGSRKWFRWLTGAAAAVCFVILMSRVELPWDGLFMRSLVTILVQPVTGYLVIVILRSIRKWSGGQMTWKEVFSI